MNAAGERIRRGRAAQKLWAALTAGERVSKLRALRRSLAAGRERLVQAIVSDTGKPALDALAGDVLVTLEQMRFYERHAGRVLAGRRVGHSRLFFRGARFRELREPHGVALIFGPANYPLQLAMVPAITALFAGNAVVAKMSERAPTVARVCDELARESGFPQDLLQIACEGPEQAGDYIDAGPDIVFFTGSSANGRTVAARAAAKLIPTVLELGGKDAAVIFADCPLQRTVEGVVYGAFSNAGQVCVGIKRLYVEQAIYGDFLRRVRERIAGLRVGTGAECDLGVLQGDRARALLGEQVKDALERGATLEAGGRGQMNGDGPLLLTNVPADARLMLEESFGPVLCVQAFKDEGEAIRLANGSEFALGASVWSRDLRRAGRVAANLNAGTCAINDVIRNIGNAHAGFGGNAASGYGRYRGEHGLRAFSRVKTVMSVRGSRTREINWFPFTQSTYSGLNRLIGLRHGGRGLWSSLRGLLNKIVPALVMGHAMLLHAEGNGHLWLRVEVPPNAHGAIGYLVFNSPEGFPGNAANAVARGFSAEEQAGQMATIDAGVLPPGRYAVTVYLDENGNHKLDAGLLGVPREPVGASNNPRKRMGPPRFTDCAFAMESGNRTLSITLVKP